MIPAMVIDILLAALLFATIVYAVLLNRRLGAFRQGKEELRALIADFSAATETARVGMDELRQTSESLGKTLKTSVDEAQALREDLGFLIDRGAAVADRLAHDMRSARDGVSAKPSANDPNDPVASLRKILEATR